MPRFSHRLHDYVHGINSLAAALAAKQNLGEPILDLTVSNPTLAGFDYPETEIRAALGGRGGLEYHPSARGLPQAREAICGYYAERGERVSPDDLLLTSSTSEAYSFLIKLLCDPGDSVCAPAPSYPLLEYLADLECCELTTYPLRRQGSQDGGANTARWAVDFAALERALTATTRAIILINPNNPTGNLLTQDEVEQCMGLARDRGIAVIVDEVFADYCLGGAAYYPAHSDQALVFRLNGFSKVLALPQVKLGWIHVSGEPGLKARALDLLEIIADTFLSVNTPVQASCAALLELRDGVQKQIRARLHRNLLRITELTEGRDELTLLRPEAGWYAVIQLHTVEPEDTVVVTLLRDAGVYIHPGQFFGFEGGCHLVVSLLTPEQDFAEGCARVVQYAAHRML
ncbi:MAG: pyridoxal phosphate-dependent aminotransferase [Candidatus Hydrogenedentes bacterium]|nr:pyridoxal phosphate-dependent aminotransferase [Candidatus Hydrogenedentota bacterium]